MAGRPSISVVTCCDGGGFAFATAGSVAGDEARSYEAFLTNTEVMVVLLLGMRSVGEAVKCVEDVLENLCINVSRPQEVEVFIMGNLSRHGLGRELLQHGLDVYQGVAAAVHQDHRRPNVASRVFGDLGELVRRAHTEWLVDVVVVHLERPVADDLEPMDDGFGAGEGVQMGVCGQFLAS